MTTSAWILFAMLALVGLVLSALYSGLETGLYTINRVRLAVRSARGDHDAIRLRRQLSHPTRTLSILLIGTNAANYLGTWALAAMLQTTGLNDWTLVAVQGLLFTPLLFIFAETLPKDLFRTHTDRWSYWLSPVIAVSRWGFTLCGLLPCVHAVTTLLNRSLRIRAQNPVTARQRISQLIREGIGAGVVSASQATLTDRVLALRECRVASVMVPWRHVVSLDIDANRTRRESVIRTQNYSRVPVVDGHRVVGVIAWYDIVSERDTPTRSLMQSPITFAPGTRLLEALSAMRGERQTMAVIVDPLSSRPLGLVTLKDLVEPLTGELTAW